MFGDGSGWHPTATPKIEASDATEEERVVRTTAEQQSFSGKTFLLSVLVGPGIALISQVPRKDGDLLLAVLPLAYLVGLFFAFFAWFLYSVQFLVLVAMEEKGWLPNVFTKFPVQLLYGALAGTASNLLVVGLPWCALRVKNSAVVWESCLTDLFLSQQVGVSVIPGLVCGLFGVMLSHRGEA